MSWHLVNFFLEVLLRLYNEEKGMIMKLIFMFFFIILIVNIHLLKKT